MAPEPFRDQLKGAIAAADQSQAVDMVVVPGQLCTGRPVSLQVPADITDLELLSLVDGVLRIGDQLRKQRGRPRLVIPQ